MSVPSGRGVGCLVGLYPLATAVTTTTGGGIGISVLPVASMSAMSLVHEHMHERAQKQDGQRQPAERSGEVGAVLDAELERGQREEDPEAPASGPRRSWRAGGSHGKFS